MRIFVERKSPYNTGDQLKKEMEAYLKVDNLKSVRVVSGFDIKGIDENQLEQVKYEIFADKQVDTVADSFDSRGADFFVTRYLDHQYDQKADVCQTMLNIEYPGADVQVKTFEIITLDGASKADISKIKEYYINPLEAREMTLSDQPNWGYGQKEPKSVAVLEGFSSLNKSQLEELFSEKEIHMAYEDAKFCQKYYKNEGKDPTVTELKILDTYWSDHCRHSTFNTVLDSVTVEPSAYNQALLEAQSRYDKAGKAVYKGERPLCLMDIATMKAKEMKKTGRLDDLEKSDEINACSIEVTGMVDGKPEDFIIMFKNETHNHPTEMEPFGGAGTCIGGCIRDPLSGRSHVFGSVRVTGSADPREAFADTMEGKLSQRSITTTAADGYSDYGNQIGVAAGHLQEFYDDGFKAKRLECGALVAYNYKRNITRENATDGDVIVMLGGKTGRDGLGGATGSSQVQKGEMEDYSAEVQKGNPLTQRNIMRLFRKPEISRIIKKSNDFGAGGVSVAIGEMAESLVIDLDKVPLKYIGMDGTEVAISESQERMAVLLDKNHVDKFIVAAEKENLLAVKVAKVTDDNRIIMSYKGQIVCDLKSDFLNSGGVRQKAQVFVKAPTEPQKASQDSLKDKWLENLSDLNVCSKKNIASQFDKTVGGQTVLYPYGGKNMTTEEQGLGMRLPLIEGNTDLGTVMTVGYDVKMGYNSPFHGGYYAVVESVMKAVSMGANIGSIRLSLQEYFERMTTDESWGKVYSALMGAYLAQDVLDIPAIGGKDSMSGSYGDINVPPTLISFAVAPVDTSKLVSKSFKEVGSNVYLIKTPITDSGVADHDALTANIELVTSLIADGKVLASSVVGAGGISGEISKMCFGNSIGIKFNENFNENLFEHRYTDVIIETKETLDLPLIGKTTEKPSIIVGDLDIDINLALDKNTQPLESVFGRGSYPVVSHKAQDKTISAKVKGGKAKALIPIFRGSNGEYSLERQIKRAGIDVETFVFRTKDAENSFKELADAIDKATILAIPSGMTSGAKPNGSSRQISIILKQQGVKDAVNGLISRGGLVIGLGEGFGALIQTGLIQHGMIKEQTDSLSLVRSAENKHYSGLMQTAVVASPNPFYSHNPKDEILPVSLLDGQVYLSDADFTKYYTAGQIVTMFSQSSPFGGKYPIESMVSPNGQVLGKLGDISQLEEGLYANVFKAETSPVFKNIADFFKE